MAGALSRQKKELKAMCKPTSSYYTERTIQPGSCPAFDYATSHGLTELQSVSHGDLTPTEVGQIVSWLSSNVKKDPSQFMRGAAYFHAITIVLSMKHSIPLSSAWTDYQLNYKKNCHSVGSALAYRRIEQLALQHLEEEMFDCRPSAGLAGNCQWGLDVGYHQNRWDPYSDISDEWKEGQIIDDYSHPDFEEYNAALTVSLCTFQYHMTNKFAQTGPNFKTKDTTFARPELTPKQRVMLRRNK